ncbi:pectinesterase-like [Cynara cardunculus var. scolymus]|uniref:Pectinesterase n=1 Tax=Cynara cardunculus var. scolymus TaxID=59895 RepID=A0A103YNW5_CYNCS|nr:pectinesterase-like [Cynara cardunculus var. scolymus]KVI12502.1 Pectinesterase, active site-containing protein [Cynara cardunculus var. scolymus]
MANKIIMSLVSLVLVVGAVLGVVALVVKSGGDSDKNVSTSTKNSVCKPTEYKDACNKVLADVDKNSSATHEDYIIASIRATADELQKALEKASDAKKEKDQDSLSHRDLESCEKMLGYATDELQQVLKVVSETQATSLVEQIDPILVWLTAVRAYQTTCIDEIRDEKLKEDMQRGLAISNELTFNAQKIFYNVIEIFKDIGIDLGDFKIPSTGHRRLLDELHEIEHSGFPAWVPTTDRKLLGAKSKAKKPKGQAIFKTPPPPPLPATVTPNAVVAQDGSGKFKGIKQALAAYPPNQQGRYIIYIKAGIYNEGQIIIEKTQSNVYMYGDGRDKTIITGSLNFAIAKIGTSQTATVAALGERFMAKGICFRNTIGPAGHQAVAFRSQSPHTVMMDCSFEGYQDTLYYHTHDQFYKNCAISGTVDFIFGTGRAFIQDSQIFVNKPDKNQANMVTADGRMKFEEAGGVVLHNCKIMASAELAPEKAQIATYLGRPWKASATSVIMLCDIGDMVRPEGWTPWESPEGKNNHMTCMFREYGNKGPGSNTAGRVKWPSVKVIQNEREAIGFTAGTFMPWLPQYGVNANLGL